MQKNIIEDLSQTEINAALQEAIAIAIKSYTKFMTEEHQGESKDFKAHHDTCKVAVAHIELLIKLSKSLGITLNAPEEDGLSVIRASLNEVEEFDNKFMEEEDDE
jgi:hypothetical protein